MCLLRLVFTVFLEMLSVNFIYSDTLNNYSSSESVPSTIFKKCCPLDEFYDVDGTRCTKILEKHHLKSPPRQVTVHGLPSCKENEVLFTAISKSKSIEHGNYHCFDNFGEHIVYLSCKGVETCKETTCIRKCCPMGEGYVQGDQCGKWDSSFSPTFYNLDDLKETHTLASLSTFGILFGDSVCKEGKALLNKDYEESYYLGTNGSLLVLPYNGSSRLQNTNWYCLEDIILHNISTYSAMECFPEQIFENSRLHNYLLATGLLISSFFLFVTFIVYSFIQKDQKNLFFKILRCYVASLFVLYTSLAVVNLESASLSKPWCSLMGYVILYASLAAFSWLNVMSIDIWRTLRCVRIVNTNNLGTSKLLYYSIYAWGVPCILTGLCATVDLVDSESFDYIKPNIGNFQRCWFSKTSNGIYVFFIAPVSLVLTCNMVLFFLTVRTCWNVKARINKMEDQCKSRFFANIHLLALNGKLFVVMGITWSLEILSHFLPHPVWYISDAANTLHGLLIFIIFVLKRKVLRKVSRRIQGPLKRTSLLTRTDSSEVLEKLACRSSCRPRKISNISTTERTTASFVTDVQY